MLQGRGLEGWGLGPADMTLTVELREDLESRICESEMLQSAVCNLEH